jgi:hypothetical protein
MSSLVLFRYCAAFLLVSVANQVVYGVVVSARGYLSFSQTMAPLCHPRFDLPQSTASGNDRLPATAFSATSASARLLHGRWSLAAAAPRGLGEGRRPADPASIRPAWRATVDVDDLFAHHRRVDPAGDLCGCIEGISTASIMPAHSGE